MMDILKQVCAYIVWIWLATSLLHGIAHVASGAPLTPLPESLFSVGIAVELFFSLGPLVALVLLYRRWERLGASLLLLCMVVALLWGFGGHFLFPGGDNVAAHPTNPASPAFLLTSILVFIIPWAGITVSACALMRAPHRNRVVRTAQQAVQARGEA